MSRQPAYKSLSAIALAVGLFLVAVLLADQTESAASVKLSAPTPIPTATPTFTCGLAWRMVESPNPNGNASYLGGVGVVSHNDVWAVASYDDDSNLWAHTLIVHWDGINWSQLPSPNPGVWNHLVDITVIAANDVWAVGNFAIENQQQPRTLIMHWDGVVWSVVPSPNGGSQGNYLSGLDAISSNDVWAVGYYVSSNNRGLETLTMHWDGVQWSLVPSPSPSNSYDYLTDVSGVSGNDVWAVGFYQATPDLPLFLHWDGQSWREVFPGATPWDIDLHGVAAIATNDVWAVGNWGLQTRTMHWDGAQWSQVPSPNPGQYFSQLFDVAAISSNDVWAVGYRGGGVLIQHWDGVEWNLEQGANYPNSGNTLNGVAALSDGDIWAVGTCSSCHGSVGTTRTLTERYHDPCALFTPTPIVTGTPHIPIPTRTPTVRTPTPTRTFTSTATPTATGTLPTTTSTAAVQLCNPTRITIHERGTATPYPSNIEVSGASGIVSEVRVGLGSLYHNYADDLDLLLVGPQGQNTLLISDAGGHQVFRYLDIILQDGATPLPDTSYLIIPPGIYGPSNYLGETWSEPDSFPLPAPPPPHTTTLSVFDGTNPNGTWSLYAFDDYGPYAGAIHAGWCLYITTSCIEQEDYQVSVTANQTMVPATNYVQGSGCSNCTVNIPLPFSYTLYGQTFNSVSVSSEGNLQFISNSSSGANTCLPAGTLNYAIMPYWDDLHTNIHDLMGTYTSVVGSAPNRIFVIRTLAGRVAADSTFEYEVLLYEGQPKFEIIYGTVTERGFYATIGVQEGTGSHYTQHSCNTQSIQAGTKLTFDRRTCLSP